MKHRVKKAFIALHANRTHIAKTIHINSYKHEYQLFQKAGKTSSPYKKTPQQPTELKRLVAVIFPRDYIRISLIYIQGLTECLDRNSVDNPSSRKEKKRFSSINILECKCTLLLKI